MSLSLEFLMLSLVQNTWFLCPLLGLSLLFRVSPQPSMGNLPTPLLLLLEIITTL